MPNIGETTKWETSFGEGAYSISYKRWASEKSEEQATPTLYNPNHMWMPSPGGVQNTCANLPAQAWPT
eukprot:599209-Amphidinium_carterae.1